MRVATLACIQDVIIPGRDRHSAHCFHKDKKYYFYYDERRGMLYAIDEIGEVHSLTYAHYYTERHFRVMDVDDLASMDIPHMVSMGLLRIARGIMSVRG